MAMVTNYITTKPRIFERFWWGETRENVLLCFWADNEGAVSGFRLRKRATRIFRLIMRAWYSVSGCETVRILGGKRGKKVFGSYRVGYTSTVHVMARGGDFLGKKKGFRFLGDLEKKILQTGKTVGLRVRGIVELFLGFDREVK